MLTYAFDLLYSIYEEEGYPPAEIPTKILSCNLYGIEIDERAGEPAAFALTMKARSRQRRFLRNPVQPNICVLENVLFEEGELKRYMDFMGHDLFTKPLQTTLRQFEEVDNFGSLICPVVTDVDGMLKILQAKRVSGQLHLYPTHQKIIKALRQADYLSPKYHVVIANPPYMGRKGMNGRLAVWTKDNYPNGKVDLFSMFMVRSLELIYFKGYMGMINLPSWLFLSSFKELRYYIIERYTINSLLHMERGIFGIDWGSVAFVIKKSIDLYMLSYFFRLHKRNFQHIYYNDIEKIFLNAKNNTNYRFDFDKYREGGEVNKIGEQPHTKGSRIYFKAYTSDFSKIPGSPIAYWADEKIISIFSSSQTFDEIGKTRRGLQTGDAGRFIRAWHEVSLECICRHLKKDKAAKSGLKWFLFNSGGTFRKWYGNIEEVVNWENDGLEIKARGKAIIPSEHYYFKQAVTWPKVSSGRCSFRWFPNGIILGDAGPCFYDESNLQDTVLCFLNSKVALTFLQFLSPTLNFEVGLMAKMPIIVPDQNTPGCKYFDSIKVHKNDWDSYETSWDFTCLPLLTPDYRKSTLKDTYKILQYADS